MRSNSRHPLKVGWAATHLPSRPNGTGSACLPETSPVLLQEKSRYRRGGRLQRTCRLPECLPASLSCCLLLLVFNHGTDQPVKLLRECHVAVDFDPPLHCGGDQAAAPLNNVDKIGFITMDRAVCIVSSLFDPDGAVVNKNEPISNTLDVEQIGSCYPMQEWFMLLKLVLLKDFMCCWHQPPPCLFDGFLFPSADALVSSVASVALSKTRAGAPSPPIIFKGRHNNS